MQRLSHSREKIKWGVDKEHSTPFALDTLVSLAQGVEHAAQIMKVEHEDEPEVDVDESTIGDLTVDSEMSDLDVWLNRVTSLGKRASAGRGRAHFFSIAKNIHDRPADADTVRHWLEEDLDVDDLSRAAPEPEPGGGASPVRLPGLEKLSLGENSLTDRTIEPLLRGLIAIGQLTSLDLSRNDIDAGGAAALREFVSNGDCPLEELVLRHADIDDDDCRALCESLASNRESRLRTLDVGDNLVGLNEGRNLCVPDYVTGGEALASALGVNVSLTKLDLSWNALRDESARALGRAFADNASLFDVNLEYNGFGDAGCEAVAMALEQNSGMRILRLAHNGVRQRGAFVMGCCLGYRRKPFHKLTFMGNHPGAIGARSLLAAVRARRGEFMVHMDGCSTHETNEDARFFDVLKPAGAYKLKLDEPYDYCVARSLLTVATHRPGCKFASLSVAPGDDPSAHAADVKLSRTEITPEQERILVWKPIIAHIMARGAFPHHKLEEVLGKCHLHPPPHALQRIREHVDGHLQGFLTTGKQPKSATKLRTDGSLNSKFEHAERKVEHAAQISRGRASIDKGKEGGRGKLTHEVMFDMIFRGAFKIVDVDGSGELSAAEIAECGSLLGTNMDEDEARRVIEEHDKGHDGALSESEYVAYMLKVFLNAPTGASAPLVDKDGQVWDVPRDGAMAAVFECEDGSNGHACHIGSDAGVRGLLAMINSASTDLEKLKLFDCATAEGGASGFFTFAQGQQIIDMCSRTAHLDVYEMCRKLATSMASPEDCTALLAHNLREDQQLALRCELGPPLWRTCVGSLGGHYCLDLASVGDREMLELLMNKSNGEQVNCRRWKQADVSQQGRRERARANPPEKSKLLSKREKKKAALNKKKGDDGALPPVAKAPPRAGAKGRRTGDEAVWPYAPDWPRRRGAALLTEDQTTALASQLVESSLEGFATAGADADDRCRRGRAGAAAGAQGAAGLVHAPAAGRGGPAGQRPAPAEDPLPPRRGALDLMPEGEAWAELRVQLLVILYRRIVDVENLHTALLCRVSHRDLLRVRHRLGPLAVFNPRHPDGYHRYTLSKHDEREVVKILVKLADEEDGKQWYKELYKRSEGFADSDWTPGWTLPVTWTDPEPKDPTDIHVPRSGTVQFEWKCSKPAWHVRDSLLHVVAAGSAPEHANLFRITNHGPQVLELKGNPELGGDLEALLALPSLEVVKIQQGACGPIPASFANLTGLRLVRLAHVGGPGGLEGPVDVIATLPLLSSVYLEENRLTGQVPNFGQDIALMQLHENRFTSLADDFGLNLSSCLTLTLNGNLLTSLPSAWMNIAEGFPLDLENGVVHLGESSGYFPALTTIELHDNRLAMSAYDVFHSLVGMTNLMVVTLQNNFLHGSLDASFAHQYADRMYWFDVSDNDFEGPIPDEYDVLTIGFFAGNPKLRGDALPDFMYASDSFTSNETAHRSCAGIASEDRFVSLDDSYDSGARCVCHAGYEGSRGVCAPCAASESAADCTCDGSRAWDDAAGACVVCPAGEGTSFPSGCEPCAPGTAAAAEDAACQNCQEIQEYAEGYGNVACALCPTHSGRLYGGVGTSASECVCEIGYYHAAQNASYVPGVSPARTWGAPGSDCYACPDGATCAGRGWPPVSREGYYGDPKDPTAFYQCLQGHRCKEAGTCVLNGDGACSNVRFECARGFEGRACARVAPYRYSTISDLGPFRCPKAGAERALKTVLAVLGVFAGWTVFNEYVLPILPELDVLLYVVQLVAIILRFAIERFPTHALRGFVLCLEFALFDVDIYAPSCVMRWTFETRFAAQLLFAAAGCAAFFAPVALLDIQHVTVTFNALSVLRCRRIGDVTYLRVDPSVGCASPRGRVLHILAGLVLATYSVGLPALVAVAIQSHGAAHGGLHRPVTLDTLGWAFRGFKAPYHAWRGRRTWLTIDDGPAQLGLCLFCVFLYAQGHSFHRPYVEKNANRLEAWGLVYVAAVAAGAETNHWFHAWPLAAWAASAADPRAVAAFVDVAAAMSPSVADDSTTGVYSVDPRSTFWRKFASTYYGAIDFVTDDLSKKERVVFFGVLSKLQRYLGTEDRGHFKITSLVTEEDRASVLFYLLSSDDREFDRFAGVACAIVAACVARPPSLLRGAFLPTRINALAGIRKMEVDARDGLLKRGVSRGISQRRRSSLLLGAVGGLRSNVAKRRTTAHDRREDAALKRMHELLGEDRPVRAPRRRRGERGAGFETALARDISAKARVDDDDDEPGFLACGAFIGGSDGFCAAPTQDAAT
ncbi:hypothetical protein JL721_2451 [Aureococcus anophagefferens]|nr:hypothetical protein JL721_2451 [Aureococcus anophagefferens]